jgi:hypothetical protein
MYSTVIPLLTFCRLCPEDPQAHHYFSRYVVYIVPLVHVYSKKKIIPEATGQQILRAVRTYDARIKDSRR